MLRASIILLAVAFLTPMTVSASSVPLTKVDTGNTVLDEQINSFYKCLTDTHQDPPPISVVDQCFSDNVFGGSMVTTDHHVHSMIIEGFNN